MLQLCIWKLQQKCQLGWSIIHTEQVHYGPNNHRFIPFNRITHLIIDMIVRNSPNNQIRTIAGCACAGNVSPPPTSKETASWRSRHASRHVRHARAVMHVGIANPQLRGKRSWHSRRMRNPQFNASGKRPMTELSSYLFYIFQYYLQLTFSPFFIKQMTKWANNILPLKQTVFNEKISKKECLCNVRAKLFPCKVLCVIHWSRVMHIALVPW